jgi:hypothetical protein
MLNRIEDRFQEVVQLVDHLANTVEDRMTRQKCLKKRWRNGKRKENDLLEGVERNLSQIYILVKQDADPDKVWKEVADAAAYLAMFADRYEMTKKGIQSIPLGG